MYEEYRNKSKYTKDSKYIDAEENIVSHRNMIYEVLYKKNYFVQMRNELSTIPSSIAPFPELLMTRRYLEDLRYRDECKTPLAK
jgi:hypothetical protein